MEKLNLEIQKGDITATNIGRPENTHLKYIIEKVLEMAAGEFVYIDPYTEEKFKLKRPTIYHALRKENLHQFVRFRQVRDVAGRRSGFRIYCVR